ncbi:MAG TPA: C4-type zinc ribbon domain-containing protein [Ktedonobacteraceae bacterium]|nr:C4-type zinc ribbon domain-containing protein [Ktedonobacteraceae bacterium]
MSTTQSAATLYQLQQLDLELERLVAEQQALATTLQANTQLKKLRMDHTRAEQELRAGLQAQKDAEWTLEELNRRLNTQEQRLYSGSITNPKELATLQQEVQHLRAQQSRQEEIALEIMEAAETLQETTDHAMDALRKAEEEWARSNAAGLLRRDQLETKRQELQAKRAQLAAAVDAELLKRYEALRRSKQGRAISRVEQNSCQWCRVILTPSEMQRVRTSSELQTCSNCGRILYYDRQV